jgi:alkaline phosphatase D
VENNYAGGLRIDDKPHLTAAQCPARGPRRYRAYYENCRCARAGPSATAAGSTARALGPPRHVPHARHRQFRDDQAAATPATARTPTCRAVDHRRAQEAWLLDGLARTRRPGTARPAGVLRAGRSRRGRADMDTWDGYRASRARIQDGWTARGVRNPLVLTGDVHCSWANDLKADYRDESSPTIGTELVCTSISSAATVRLDAIPNRRRQPAPALLLSPAAATCGRRSADRGCRWTSVPSSR